MRQIQLLQWSELSRAQQLQARNLAISDAQVEYAGAVDTQLRSVESESGEDLVGIAILVEEEVVGFLVLKRASKAPDWAASGAAVISGMRIDSSRQGQGLGRAALQKLPGWVSHNWPQCNALVLSVDEDNAQGIKAYSAAGFKDLGQRVEGRIGWVRYMSRSL